MSPNDFQPPLFVFVDPAAGHQGVHNLGFVDVLAHHAPESAMHMVLAAHQQIDAACRARLTAAGVEVLAMFATEAYQFHDQQPSVAALTPYTMQLALEYEVLMLHVAARWPGRVVHWVFHTSPWRHLQALAVALRAMPAAAVPAYWRFHLYLMYWHGMDANGVTLDPALKMRYRVCLSDLARRPTVRFYTSSAAYLPGYQAMLAGMATVRLHPFFLGHWHAQPAPVLRTPPSVRRVLAYSGDAREIKGFLQLPGCVQTVLDRFAQIQTVWVHTARPPYDMASHLGQVWSQLHNMAGQDPRVVLQEGFLSHQNLLHLLAQVDLLVLNYDPGAYCHKTSGFVWLAAQLGVPCAVTAHTWLEREAERLGVTGWRIVQDKQGTCWEPLASMPDEQVAAYRAAILQPFEPWLLESTTK